MKIDKNLLIRRSICAVVAFVLSVCLMLATFISVVYVACSEKYITYTQQNSKYAELSLETLKTELADLTIPGGFPLDFFDSRIDQDLYKLRVKESFISSVNGSSVSYSIRSVSDEFYKLLSEYVLEEDGEIVPEVEEGLHGMADECAKCYVKYSNPSSVKLVTRYFATIKKALKIAVIVVAVLLVASAVLLVFLCKKRDLLKHLFFSFAGGSLLSGVLPLVLLLLKEIQKVSLTLPALYFFTVNYVNGILSLLLIIAGGLLLIALILLAVRILLYFLSLKKQLKTEQEKSEP